MNDADDYMYDQYDDDFEQEEDDDVDCGLMPDGQCALAGTEHCDWDCGALNEQRIEAMKKATCVHCAEPSVTNLDSENLCKAHADEWVKGEGMAARERENRDYQT